MSRLKKRQRQAAQRGNHIWLRGSLPGFYATEHTKYDVYVEAETSLGPRGLSLTKREAIAMAYQIGISAKQKLTVTFN